MSTRIYTNPRMAATIADWPSGRHRTTAYFLITTDMKRGQRGERYTINPKTGNPNASKLLTYGNSARIVDGDDGRTYILVLSTMSNHITVFQSTMQFEEETVFTRDPRYAELLALVTSV